MLVREGKIIGERNVNNIMSLNHFHFPEWLMKSSLFRKIFLLRKIFLTRKRFYYYGQMAEDVALNRFFPKKYIGFFVDVGCFHPIKFNNTYRFYKRGWRGINLDIDSIKIEGFKIMRPKDVNINCAISDQEGETTYWTNGFYSPTVTLHKPFADSKQGKKYQYEEKKTKTNTLTNTIDNTEFKNQEIDLLSIDVEGFDFSVLKSLDFERYKPKVIAIESHLDDFDQVQRGEIYKFLIQKNYKLANWVGITLIFKSNA